MGQNQPHTLTVNVDEDGEVEILDSAWLHSTSLVVTFTRDADGNATAAVVNSNSNGWTAQQFAWALAGLFAEVEQKLKQGRVIP